MDSWVGSTCNQYFWNRRNNTKAFSLSLSLLLNPNIRQPQNLEARTSLSSRNMQRLSLATTEPAPHLYSLLYDALSCRTGLKVNVGYRES